MSKRDFGSAFSSGGMMVTAGYGFDAPQPQTQLYAPNSPTALLRIPGQWPQDHIIAAEHEPFHFAQASFFTTESKLATAVTCMTRLLGLPIRLAQRFLRRQTIRAVPVIRQNGSSKKRLVDAGPAEEQSPTRPRMRTTRRCSPPTPTPSSRPPFSGISPLVSRLVIAPPSTVTSRSDWSPPPTPQITTSPADWSPSSNAQAIISLADWSPSPALPTDSAVESSDADSDDEDFSFSDVTSGTPPHNPQTGSPTNRVWNAKTLEFQEPSPSVTHKRTPPLIKQSIGDISPATHQRILRRAAITPTQRHLHRVQLRGRLRDVAQSPLSPHTDHTVPSPVPLPSLNSDLKEKASKASALKLNAEHVARQAYLTNSRYQALLESRAAKNAEIRAAEAHHAEIAQADLVDAADEDQVLPPVVDEYENDLSFLEDAPTPQTKSVRWTEHGEVKPFYFDERVSEMLDSTLETIASAPSPARISALDSVSSDDDEQDYLSFLPPSATKDRTEAPKESVGFHGVPADTWDDSVGDSLDESQISIELFEELQADLEKKLALAPPPVVLKPLVAPLTEDEKALLDSAAAKTSYGLDQDAQVVKRKLSARDFGTLLPEQFNGSARAWLNDEIVNEYLSILVGYEKHAAGFEHKRNGPAPPVHAFTSHWYTSVNKGVKSVERWAGRVQLAGKQFLDADLLLYPICDGSHWRLLAVKPKDRTIEYLDSLGLDGKKYIKKMREYLAHELQDLYHADEWVAVEHQRSSRQLNGSDCGVFTLLNALALLRDEDAKRVIPFEGMLEARQRIAVTLMAGQPTTEMN